jgi:hypothetical protein
MKMTLRLELSGLLAVVAVLSLFAATASADPTKTECVAANGAGQDLRRDGKFAEAREQFQRCNDAACPTLLAEDCTVRLDELESAQPTVVFDVKDRSGHDVSAVKVTIDGEPFTSRLVGAAQRVDPGDHVFTFAVPGQGTVTERMVIKETEKGRHVRVFLGGRRPRVAGPEPEAAAAEYEPESSTSRRKVDTRKIFGIVATGTGVTSVVVGSVFGMLTMSAIADQKAVCPSTQLCSNRAQANSDHATWSTDSTISDAAFIAGGVLVAGGVYLLLTGHHGAERPQGRALVVAPSVARGGGSMLLRGEF